MLLVKDTEKMLHGFKGEYIIIKSSNQIYNELEHLEQKIQLNTDIYEKYLQDMRDVKREIAHTLDDYNAYIQNLYGSKPIIRQVNFEKIVIEEGSNEESTQELIEKVESMSGLITERLKHLDTKYQQLNRPMDEELKKLIATNEVMHGMANYIKKSAFKT